MRQEDFLTIEINDGIATFWMDHQFEKMNVVSPDVMDIFDKAFLQIETDDAVKAAIIISKKKDFMGGADIKSFAIEQPGDFEPIQRRGLEGLARLEAGKKPVIAAIHGTAFGLGTELSLACHARICSDDPRTKFALPEVKLGLLPGGGGTQRLPRTIGLQKALNMVLTGSNLYAYPAKKLGLVDEVTHHHKLHQAATMLAKRMLSGKWSPKRPKKSLINRFLENTSIGRSIVFKQAKKMAMKQSQGNYPAIPAILDTIETGYKKGIKAGYEKELEYFEKLMLTPESKALRSLFFLSTEKKKNPMPDLIKPIDTLGMIGAGFMGAGIAEVTANKGMDVLLKDIKPEVITTAEQQIWKGIAKKLKRKSITKAQAEETFGHVRGQLSYNNFEQADIVIEAVLEKMDLKKIIINDIQNHGKDNVIIASNTSSLSVTEMGNHAKHPELVIGMHYFSPVPKMPLLEIVQTDKTADWVIASCYDFGVRQGKTCIVVKDGPGFYVNRILGPYMNECLIMINEGCAIDFVDKALLKKGFPVGPMTLFDEVGLDIAAHVVGSSEKLIKDRPGFSINYSVVKMFEAGRLGKKNKKGFFSYNAKGKKDGVDQSAYGFFDGNGNKNLPLDDVQNRALMLMLNEAAMCLEEGIIKNAKDGDIGAVFGIGFLPFTGGPFRYMDLLGIDKVVAIMEDLVGRYGEKFTPVNLLKEMAKKGQSFYN